MYDTGDTITAISSPTGDHRVILRLNGPRAIDILNQIFNPKIRGNPGISRGTVSVTNDINLDSVVYFFRSPHSYTGDDLAEIHLWANSAITQALLEKLISLGARPAGAGEFTARAYLNNKIDLAQAEAVNEVVTASNEFQLAAAENLLAGQSGRTREKISSVIIDCISQLEAGLDFSTEDIIPANQAAISDSLNEAIKLLHGLLAGSVQSESIIDLPAVGIAGAPNAGKSTLLNKLLGRQRSIVSHQHKTTRDVLTGELIIDGCRCVLFDCAGLLAPSNVEGITKVETILDELSQQAAIEALQNATAVIFCVDTSKPDWAEDLAVRNFITPGQLIAVATKTDLIANKDIARHAAQLKSLFGCDFLPVSVHNDSGLDKLRTEIVDRLIKTHNAGRTTQDVIALTARHRQAINNTIHDIIQAEKEIKAGNDEVAVMMLRLAHSQLVNIGRENIDEQVLDRIFSRFCIGK